VPKTIISFTNIHINVHPPIFVRFSFPLGRDTKVQWQICTCNWPYFSLTVLDQHLENGTGPVIIIPTNNFTIDSINYNLFPLTDHSCYPWGPIMHHNFEKCAFHDLIWSTRIYPQSVQNLPFWKTYHDRPFVYSSSTMISDKQMNLAWFSNIMCPWCQARIQKPSVLSVIHRGRQF
jgi:hypothetical protein